MNKYDMLAIALSPTTVSVVTILAVLRGYNNVVDWIIAILSVVVGPVLPVISLAALRKTDLNVTDQAQRTPLLMLAVLSYFLGFSFFHLRGIRNMEFVTLSYSIVTVGVAAINAFYTKGSVHMAGIAGPSTLLILLGKKEGIFLLLLIPLVAWIRLKVRAHTEHQIIVGGFVAVILTILAYLILF
jgi:membrane-associated phospholipid phosphatase